VSGGGRRRRRVVVALLATPWTLWALARTLELDRFHPAVALMSFTPLVAATAIVPLLVALVTREWVVAAVAAAALALFVIAVAPRALDGPQLASDATKGPRLVVMTANLKFGEADPRAVVALVREHHVDVLSLEELTPEAVAGLDAAGMRGLLPARLLRPRERAAGTGLMARRPLAAVRNAPGASLQASLALAGGHALRFVAVHPFPPLSAARVRT
jgi:endonuclease/exonuclease/phosphatase (EEP) superfamily protein YafD